MRHASDGGVLMVAVSVSPDSFTMVFFDAAVIGEVATEVAERLGFDDDTLAIEVDEASPLGRSRVASYDPVVIAADGGAFEDTRRPRSFSRSRTTDVIGRSLLRVLDRRSGRFDDAPDDDGLDLALHSAWDVYSVGRLERLGYSPQRKRRLYQFRNRHGFTDAADAAFDELWGSSELSWSEIARISTDCRRSAGLRVES